MTHIPATEAPRFDAGGTHVTGLASPSRGARDTSVWRLSLDPGSSSPVHSLTREEVFVALAGRGHARIGSDTQELLPGDALVVPVGEPFAISNPGDEPFEAVVCLPVGGRAIVAGEELVPPWAA
jgi:mannose-6-phosphate isomerase-like protein (cupin superfamily)